MKKADILAKTNEELIAGWLRCETRMTHETNTRRGLSKKTIKEYDWFLEETAKRFGLDTEVLRHNIFNTGE